MLLEDEAPIATDPSARKCVFEAFSQSWITLSARVCGEGPTPEAHRNTANDLGVIFFAACGKEKVENPEAFAHLYGLEHSFPTLGVEDQCFDGARDFIHARRASNPHEFEYPIYMPLEEHPTKAVWISWAFVGWMWILWAMKPGSCRLMAL